MLEFILSESSILPDWLQTVAVDLGTLWPIVLFIGAAYGLVRWISKRFKEEVRELIVDEVTPIKAEFQNNGGSSVKDAIDRLDANYKDLKTDVSHLRGDVSHLKGDVDHIKSDLDGISERATSEHKLMAEKISKIEQKNNFIWDEIQKRRPAFEAYEAHLKKTKADF